MKQLLWKVLSLLSESQSHRLYRWLTVVPKEYNSPDYTVEIARTAEDLESAYALLHECYRSSSSHCRLFSLLPTSAIFVAKFKGKVVGAVSTIRDSRAGLPSDQNFRTENDHLRAQGKTLAEASALAIAHEHKGRHAISFLLMKYSYFYCRRTFGADHIILTVPSQAQHFYQALLQFEHNGSAATAVHLSLDLSPAHQEKIVQAFGANTSSENFGFMWQAEDSRFHDPSKQLGQSLTPVITSEILKQFCLKYPEIWSTLPQNDQDTLLQVYSTYFGPDSLWELYQRPTLGNWVQQEYRTSLQVPAVINSPENFDLCEILDLTSSGCYLTTTSALPMVNDRICVTFYFEDQLYCTEGQVVWRNEGSVANRRRGFGFRFDEQLSSLKGQLLGNWPYQGCA